ncbi:SRPBCC domain-containing protein [Pelagibius sp.]|uniref:SRPBCC family protein n=1 Tax=Pelagibius sp. TaxID=1931238 RepID=UPI0026190C7F|nr:SRPBCC domain-containing protein [Pelagibius sp.]
MVETALSQPVVRLTRRLDATPELVFDAWTDPQMVRQWLVPGEMVMAALELDLRVGGRFDFVMKGEETYAHRCVYREIERPRRLVFTWSSSATAGRDTLVTVEIKPLGEGSELTLTHEGFTDQAMAELHNGGWTACFEKFVPFVED